MTRSQIETEIKKINNIQKFSSSYQKNLNNGYKIVLKAQVQLMFELEIPQSESKLYQLFEKVVRSCKIYNQDDMNTIVDYIMANTDEDFINDISEILN